MTPDEHPDLQAFVNSLPEPNDESRWDTIFLLWANGMVPRMPEYWAWFRNVCLDPRGEAYDWWHAQQRTFKEEMPIQ